MRPTVPHVLACVMSATLSGAVGHPVSVEVHVTADELAAFDRRARQLLPPDATAWTIHGDTAVTS